MRSHTVYSFRKSKNSVEFRVSHGGLEILGKLEGHRVKYSYNPNASYSYYKQFDKGIVALTA